MSRQQRTLIWTCAISIVVYLIFVAVLFLAERDTFAGSRRDLLINVAAGAFNDISFFVVVGIVVAFLSVRNPADDFFQARVEYLFSGGAVSPDAFAFASRKIEELGCIAEEVVRSVQVVESDPTNHLHRIYVISSYRLRNILSNQPIRINVGPSITPELSLPEGTPLGELVSLVSTPEIGLAQHHVQFPQPIPRSGLHLEVFLEIPPGRIAAYTTTYWLWIQWGEDLFFSPKRFTERFAAKYSNSTESDVLISSDPSGKENVRIPKGFTHSVAEKASMKPGEFSRIWWCYPDGRHHGTSQMPII